MSKKNGYVRIPTEDPFLQNSTSRKAKVPKSLRPGLFYMFGNRGRFAVDHSDSEKENVELKEMRPRRPKHRKSKSPKSPQNKQPKQKLVMTCIEEPILQGDTVQRIALRYGCPVSELYEYDKGVFIIYGMAHS